jgi:predicted dehydrogenase
MCEKPLSGVSADEACINAAAEKAGKWVMIGYQWSYSEAINALKADITAGVYGRPEFLKTIVCWPRPVDYFTRGTGWGGKLCGPDGTVMNDSVMNNATAHYLHNMFFLLGKEMTESAYADSLEADCFRANEIETFDTCTLRGRVDGVPIYFAATHAAECNRNPAFVYRFENAVVTFTEDVEAVIRAKFNDGREVLYGNPFADEFKKLWDCVDAVQKGQRPICTVKTAMAHTALIAKLHESTTYRPFPSEDILLNAKADGVYVKGLLKKMYRAYEEEKLLSEL